MEIKKDYINTAQICEYLGGISKTTFWRLLQKGILPPPKLRISKTLILWDFNEVKKSLALISQDSANATDSATESAKGGLNE
ncbi:MAG: helix-turn-helix domain-containing protein [Campylobacter sp.]|nr:helix-turn-helix domain-containing protein [Campylobacter sp.]